MTGQPRAIRILYTYQDRFVASAIRRAISVTTCSSLPVFPDHAISHCLTFPEQDERTLLIYSSHWDRVNTRDFFVKASAAVKKEEWLFDVRVLVVPPVSPSSGFLQYLQDSGASLAGPHNVLSCLAGRATRYLELQEVPENAALGREIAGSIRHGDQGRFLADAAKMEHLIPWLHKHEGE
ncbi:MAG: hypothetical protein GY835_03650 [bacterium]|nr:hypothetical protein [bacterium]